MLTGFLRVKPLYYNSQQAFVLYQSRFKLLSLLIEKRMCHRQNQR